MTLPSKVFDVFKGSFLHIITRSIRGTSKQSKATGNVISEGFLLEEDAEYLFFGDTPDEVTSAINRQDIVKIYIPIEELMAVFQTDGQEEH